MASCWSGPVTVCSGIGMGMYDMVVVSKCSMARGGVAVVGDGGAVDSAHTRGASGAEPATSRAPAMEQRGASCGAAAVLAAMAMAERRELVRGRVLGLEVERCGRPASGEDGGVGVTAGGGG